MNIVSRAMLGLVVLFPAIPAGAETSMGAWTLVEYVKEAGRAKVQQYNAEYSNEGLRVRNLDGTVTRDPDAKPTRLESPLNTAGPNSASSYADLTTGKLGAAAFVQGSGANYSSGLGNGYAEGIASFGDDLTFAAANADAATTTTIDYEIAVHALLSGTGAWEAYGTFAGDGSRSNFWVSNSTTFSSTADITRTSPSSDLSIIRGRVSFVGATWTPNLYLQLKAYARADGPDSRSMGSANLMNTATIRFDLPTNVTMTSASGAFLSAANNSAVPEPATWMTMILGFGVIGHALRRKTVLRFV